MADDIAEEGDDVTSKKHPCYGCERRRVCGNQHDQKVLSKLTLRRTDACDMRWPCHTVFGEQAARPADDKATRRLVGEAGLQY